MPAVAVATTVAGPAGVAGTAHSTEVSVAFTTTHGAPAMVNVACASPTPSSVTSVPPRVGAERGNTEVNSSAGEFTVRALLDCPATVSCTDLVPTPAGSVHLTTACVRATTGHIAAPTITVGVSPKFAPDSVNTAPAVTGLGDTELSSGAAKSSAALALAPATVACTVTPRPSPSGSVQVRLVWLLATPVHALVPTSTEVAAPEPKFVPASVSTVPPAVGTTLGVTPLTVGVP